MTLSEHEVEQRISLLRRFRSMLEAQRAKFRNYLSVLDVQEQAISDGNTEKVAYHAEIEQAILGEILSLQKVIDPLQEMYQSSFPGGDREITALQESLGRLQTQVLQRNQDTRAFLRQKKEELSSRIHSLRIPKAPRSVYSRTTQPSLLDLRA
jgi:hypothetical protein